MYTLLVYRRGSVDPETIRATGRTEIIATVSRLFNARDGYERVVVRRGARTLFIIDAAGVRRPRKGE